MIEFCTHFDDRKFFLVCKGLHKEHFLLNNICNNQSSQEKQSHPQVYKYIHQQYICLKDKNVNQNKNKYNSQMM